MSLRVAVLSARPAGLALTIAVLAGCAQSQEQQQVAAVHTQPRLTTIASSSFAAIYGAQPSGGVAVDVAGTNPSARASAAPITMSAAQTLYIAGWAFPARQKSGCSAIGLAVDNKRVFAGTYGYRRPDVAASYKDPSRSDVGYTIQVSAGSLGQGSHRGFVFCLETAETASRSFNPLTIAVR